jgi:hypothetical protein
MIYINLKSLVGRGVGPPPPGYEEILHIPKTIYFRNLEGETELKTTKFDEK